MKPQAKHTLKVHVWASISARGTTKICIFDQTMDAPLYIEILRGFLLPFIEEKFQESGYWFMQDNYSKHTSKKAKEFYEQQGINWLPTPASEYLLAYFLFLVLSFALKHEQHVLLKGRKQYSSSVAYLASR